VYTGNFDPTDPLKNYLAGNDDGHVYANNCDNTGQGHCPVVSNLSLTQGQNYTFVISTYYSVFVGGDLTLPQSFYVTGPASVNISVYTPAALSLTPSSLTPSGNPGSAITTVSFTAAGGSGVYSSYALNAVSGTSIAGLGLSFSTTTGAITGTPNASGTSVFTVTVTDNAAHTATSAQVTLTVASANAAPTVSVGPAITGTVQIGQLLTGSYTYNDAESDPESGTTYRWVRSTDNSVGGDTDVATTTTYTLQSADAGKYLFYCVTPKSSVGTSPGTEACSAATIQVPAVVNGTCITGQTLTSAPSSGQCSAGTASNDATTNTAYTWTCTGSGGGTSDNTCSATRNYAVTTSAGANGSIGASQNVAYNATPSFTVTPSGGYYASMGGTCGGSLSGTTYTTNAVTAACTVSATFIANAAPTASSLTVTGTAQIGSQLTGSYTFGDTESDAQDTSGSGTGYRWVRADNTGMTTNPVSAASGFTLGNNQTYTVLAADAGKYLFYCVTPKASVGTATGSEACSTATTQVPTPASISGVTAPSNGTYRAAQNLDFVLQFSGNVTVDTTNGTPRIALTVGGSTVYATYLSGSGGTTLTFRYAVQNGDTDSDGINATSPIDLNGGTLIDANSQNATLTWTVPSLTGVKVDTSAPTAPTVVGPSNAFYKTGQNLDFTVTYGETVLVTGTPRIALTLGSSTVYADYASGSNSSALTFRYTVLAGDTDTDGIAAASPIDLNTGSIKDSAGNDATLTYTVPTLTSVFVDTTVPAVHATTPIAAANGSNGGNSTTTYDAQDIITLKFTEPVLVANITNANIVVNNGHTLDSPTIAATDKASYNNTHATTFTLTLGANPTVVVGDTLTIALANVVDRAANAAASNAVFTLPGFNALPTAGSVAVALPGGTAAVAAGVQLTGSYVFNDSDSDSESGTTFQWYTATNSNCTTGQATIAGATASTYTVLASQEGKYLCFGVTPKAATGNSPGVEVLAASSQFASAAPTLASSVPADAATGAALNTTLSLTFNEDISAIANAGGAPVFWLCDAPQGAGPYNLTTCPAIATFEVGANTNNNAAPGGTAVINGKIVTLSLPVSVTLSYSKQYYLFASNAAVQDAVSNAFAGAQVAFTTAAAPAAADPTPTPTPIVTPQPGTTPTTINTGGGNVPVVGGGTVTVTSTAPNQALLATTQTTGTGSGTSTTPAIVVTANQTGATATGSGSSATPTLQVTGSTTVTVQAGAQVSGTVLNLVPPTSGGGATTATVNVGGQSITVAPDSGGSTQVTFTTVDIGGVPTPVLQVTGGSASITGSTPGQPLLAMGSNAATAGSCANQPSNVVTRLDDQGRITEATVTQCYIVLPSGAFRSTRATTERRLWAGEQALWNQDGVLTTARLGSPASNRGWTGDPLVSPTVDGLNFAAGVPRLAGNSTRLNVDVEQHFFAQLATLGLTRQDGTDGYGVFFVDWRTDPVTAALLNIPNRDYRYVAMPIGRVTVDVTETVADGVSLPGNGDYRFTKDGLSITVAPAVADLAALAAYVKKLGGGTTVQEDGSYLIELAGRHYALQAGYGYIQGATPGAGNDAAGNVTWTDAQGREQPLYPVAADFATLKAEVLKLDANATVRGNGEGLVEIVLNGQQIVLVPAYELVAVPTAHANDAWWIETDGLLYLRYPTLDRAQGFTIK